MKVDYITNQGTGIINQDSVLIGNNIFGVFDGTTSLDKYVENGKTGGYLASEFARKTFAKNDKLLVSLFKEANDRIELI